MLANEDNVEGAEVDKLLLYRTNMLIYQHYNSIVTGISAVFILLITFVLLFNKDYSANIKNQHNIELKHKSQKDEGSKMKYIKLNNDMNIVMV